MAFENRTLVLILALAVAFLSGYTLSMIISPVTSDTTPRTIFTKNAPEPIGPYSQAVRSGNFVFVSGQVGIDPATGNITASVEGQTVRAMENLRAILRESGLSYSDVVDTRIYLVDMQDFTTVNRIYAGYFNDTYPARATLQVAGLPKGAAVEIEAVARAR